MLGGPEEALFERSPRVGREERPPNVVVVYPNQVLHYFVLLCFIVNVVLCLPGRALNQSFTVKKISISTSDFFI